MGWDFRLTRDCLRTVGWSCTTPHGVRYTRERCPISAGPAARWTRGPVGEPGGVRSHRLSASAHEQIAGDDLIAESESLVDHSDDVDDASVQNLTVDGSLTVQSAGLEHNAVPGRCVTPPCGYLSADDAIAGLHSHTHTPQRNA